MSEKKSDILEKKSDISEKISDILEKKSDILEERSGISERIRHGSRNDSSTEKKNRETRKASSPQKKESPKDTPRKRQEKIEQRWLIHNKRQQRRVERTVFKSMKLKSENKLVYLQADKCTLEKTLIAKVEKVVLQ